MDEITYPIKTLREMALEVYDNNVKHGWRGDGSPSRSFVEEIALLHSEVSEALEAYRDHGLDDVTMDAGSTHLFKQGGTGCCAICDDLPDQGEHALPKPEGVGSELADVLIRLLDTAYFNGVDLQQEYERKMAYNRTRPFRHGGKRI